MIQSKFGIIFLVCFVVFAGRDGQAADVKLVESGKAACTIVVADNASRPERFGANELAAYLDKVTGCGKIDVLDRIDRQQWRGRYLVEVAVRNLPELKTDGSVADYARVYDITD